MQVLPIENFDEIRFTVGYRGKVILRNLSTLFEDLLEQELTTLGATSTERSVGESSLTLASQ